MEALNLEDLDALVDAAYEAALEPQRWQEFCEALDTLIGGAYVSLHGHDLTTRRNQGMFYTRHAPEFVASYMQRYDRLNPFPQAVKHHPLGVALNADEIVDKDRFIRTEFYNEWLRPQENIRDGAGVLLSEQGARVILLSAHLPQRDAAIKMPRLMATLKYVGPHMRRAVRHYSATSAKLGRSLALESMLEEANCALLVLDKQGRPLDVNDRASAMFRSGVLSLDHDGILQVRDPNGAAFLKASLDALEGCHTGNKEDSAGIALGGANARGVLRTIPVAPSISLGGAKLFGAQRVPALIVSIMSAEPLLESARARFALSAAETAVLRGLLSGKAARALAAERDTSINTVRNQIGALLSKTGTSSQKEMLSLFARQSIL